MEVIEVSSYTENEKFHIAKKYLVPKQLERNGLTGEMLSFSDKALEKIIHNYTREAGVRNLERRIGEICRKAAREFFEKNGNPCISQREIFRSISERKDHLRECQRGG